MAMPAPRRSNPSRAATRAYVRTVRATTVCAVCGAQPIDWHHEDHTREPHRRVSRLVGAASRERIDAEIARCTPLCRRHHMEADGRLAAAVAAGERERQREDPKPCVECGRPYKPLRRGLCSRCYDRERDHGRRRRYAQ
jgi:hypothetical protein